MKHAVCFAIVVAFGRRRRRRCVEASRDRLDHSYEVVDAFALGRKERHQATLEYLDADVDHNKLLLLLLLFVLPVRRPRCDTARQRCADRSTTTTTTTWTRRFLARRM